MTANVSNHSKGMSAGQMIVIAVLALMVLTIFSCVGLMILGGLSPSNTPAQVVVPYVAPTTDRPASTSAPSTVYAVSCVSWTENKSSSDTVGNDIFTGKIYNKCSTAIQFVELRGTIYDANHIVVNSATGFVDSDLMQPGAYSTYTVYVSDPNLEARSGQMQVASAYFVK